MSAVLDALWETPTRLPRGFCVEVAGTLAVLSAIPQVTFLSNVNTNIKCEKTAPFGAV